jgi:ABC-type amino acid transport substrate-binding protein
MSGVFYDLMEETGKQLHLKIEWTTEATLGQMMTDLALGRYDMVCSSVYELPERAREGAFSVPLFYSPSYLYVREGDTRFDNHYERVNRPDIKLSELDGEFSSVAHKEFFPQAAGMALPQTATGADIFSVVASGKADAVASDPYSFADFIANNPHSLRQVKGKPLLILGVGMPMVAGEPELKNAIDTTLSYLVNTGYVDKVLNQYPSAAASWRVAVPYREP